MLSNKLSQYDTIAAIATPSGGGISIVRISGEKTIEIVKKLFKGAKYELESHRIYYGRIVDGESVVDEVLLTVMLAPKTYTREDVAEINCHGGIRTVQRILNLVVRNGARLAEPGEFTKRAFLNGRIDLSQAEAVADLINAKTNLAQKTALNQLEGKLSGKVGLCMDKLLGTIAHIEASIDYPEHDEAGLTNSVIEKNIVEIIEAVNALLKTADGGRVIAEGIETVILGKPNVGKSSLLNALLDEQRAIVTDIAGTTRDVLKELISLDDIPLKISDTAGIRRTDDAIEKIGVERSKKAAENANLILLVLDGSEALSDEDIDILEENKDRKMLVLVNKTDLENIIDYNLLYEKAAEENIIEISAKTAIGLDTLRDRIKEMFFAGDIDYENTEVVSSARHKAALEAALQSLQAALETTMNKLPEDFISIDLLAAYHHLGEITGENADEDLINKIFSEFCLGK